MRMRLLTTLLALLLAAPALAVDVWGGPPPDAWPRFAPDTTFQHWDFAQPLLPLPDVWDNPYGEPWLEFLPPTGWEYSDAWECPPELDPGQFVDGWHCFEPDGGQVVITIPNTDNPDGAKYIFMQITSSKAPSDVGVSGTGSEPGGYTPGTWSTGRPQIQWPGPAPFGGVWYTYNYGLKIEPNPQAETIVIEVPYCTVIDQIVIDTYCTNVVAYEKSTWGDVKRLFR